MNHEIDFEIDLADNKYKLISYKTGELKALRYENEWQNLTGDNLVYAMAVEIIKLKEKVTAAENCLVCACIADPIEVIENTLDILRN